MFRLASAAAVATGWHPYDPQEGTALALDDDACEAALLIYQSVMDQLRPAGAVPSSPPG